LEPSKCKPATKFATLVETHPNSHLFCLEGNHQQHDDKRWILSILKEQLIMGDDGIIAQFSLSGNGRMNCHFCGPQPESCP
jgi:hypothetical protein